MQPYNYEELEHLAHTLNQQLQLLFIKSGIDAQIFTDLPYIHQKYPDKYPDEFTKGVWQVAIDVNTYKDANGQDVLPHLTENDIVNGLIYDKFKNFPMEHQVTANKSPQWNHVTWTGGRVIFIIFANGQVKRVPSTYVYYSKTIDSSPACQIIHDILTRHYEHQVARVIDRTKQIKMELCSYVTSHNEVKYLTVNDIL